MIPTRTLTEPPPQKHHLPHFHFPPSPDATAPSSPSDQPPLLPDTPRRRIHHHTSRRLSAGSSSSSSGDCPSTPLQIAGIGRKVAEALELFKESEERPPKSETGLAKRRFTTSHPNDGGVEEARYEFVKRADWPDPETAALRRERSSTTLENVRSRESIDSLSWRDPVSLSPRRDPPFSDPSHWRKDVSRQDTTIRGRRRRRASDISILDPHPSPPQPSPITVPQSPCIRPHSRAYPPSPSPSRSPTDRIPPLALYNPAIDSASITIEPESSGVLTSLNRSPTPTHISSHASPIASPSHMLPSPTRSFSPWSTDDEFSFSQVQDSPIDPVEEREKIRPSLAHKPEDDVGSYSPNLWNADSLNMVYGESEESLPHIPLRPFRNQVGGHRSISIVPASCLTRESIRRVLRGSATPPSSQPSPSLPVAVSHFSGSLEHASYGGLPQEGVGSEVMIEEAELPEVALDRNRHIIPKWLLHRGHLHDRTSHTESLRPSLGSRQRLHSTQLSGATASSPALIQNQDAVKPSSKRLSRQSTIPFDDGDPYRTGNTVRAASSFADPRSAWEIVASEDPPASRPELRQFQSEVTIGSQQSSPSWFGGTGSTTVNTKLKDHIFSTVLRRFHRRCNSRWLNGSHTEDEREAISAQQGQAPASPPQRSTSRKQYAGSIVKEQENDCYASALRRARSDSEMGRNGLNSSFDIEYEKDP